MKDEILTDVAIIGAGTAGMYAMREVRRAGRAFVLLDHGPLGTTCARVGCMPSKVALRVGSLWADRKAMTEVGVRGGEALSIDLCAAWAEVRRQRDRFVGNASDKARSGAGDNLLEGRARFIEPTLIELSMPDRVQRIRARSVVLATGSRPVMPGWLQAVRDRTITTDELFELQALPRTIGVLGLGAIGLEMGLALARLGVRVVGVEMMPHVGGITDPEVAERARVRFGSEMELWLGAEARVSRTGSGVLLNAGGQQVEVEMLLAALGRRPNTDELGLEAAGFPLDARGNPCFDPATLQVAELPVFIAGDANADRPLMHEAADQGAMAGFNAAAVTPMRFARKVALAIAFTAPDVVSVGLRWEQFGTRRPLIGTALGQTNGRAQIIGAVDSLLHVYADADDGRLLGASMMASGGEHLAHLLAWAIQRGETAADLLTLPFYHPVIEEMLQSALQDIVRQLPSSSSCPLGLMPTIETPD